ncbi:MAG TPA: ComF family protein [Anaerovoracaceae bacterium]|nr:ComF family protein [Anaerovoracaceae bacterium]
MNKILSSFGEGFFDLIYPANIYCISCGNIIDDSRPYALCDFCVRTLKWANGRTCGRCGKILQEDYGPDLCTDCIDGAHVFEKGYTCVEYGPVEREMILRFKYKNQAYLGRKLAEIMYDRIRAEAPDADIVLPVPMFVRKERQRGYNQAAVLAASLAKLTGIPYDRKLLLRTIETEAMSRLGALDRKRNIREVFSVPRNKREKLAGKTVLLVDDIYTTGSTADACAATLLEAGASKVIVFTFASGANLNRGESESAGDRCNQTGRPY